nr:putative capsid protein [Crucivirus sp.]
MPYRGSYKRKSYRSRSRGLGPYSRKLLKAAYREEKKFPSSVYGKMHMMRGVAGSETVRNFGANFKTADAAQLAARKVYGWRGRGGYNLASAYKQSGLGRFINPVLGAASNRAVSMIGSGLYSGRGAYSNNLVEGASDEFLAPDPPAMASAADETGAVTISHREYLSDVYAPGTAGSGIATTFQNTSYSLNPGLQSTFTFLSQIAQNFDEYEFIQLLFHYRSTTTDIGSSTTGQCGTIIMTTNYNASTAPFADKQSMIEYAHSHSVKVTENMTHGVECHPDKTALSTHLYTRSQPVQSGQDIKTYDHGLFQLAIANCPSAFNGLPIGELWCEYTVVLRKPKLFTSRGLEIDRDVFVCSGGNGTAATGINCNASAPFGSGFAFPAVFSNLPTSFVGQQNSIGCLLSVPGCPSNCTVPASAIGAIGLFGFTNTGAITATAINAALSTNQIQITFPAAYTSNVRVLISFSGFSASLASFDGRVGVLGSGNVVGVSDMYAVTTAGGGAAQPASVNMSPGPAGGQTFVNATITNWVLEIHCFVKQSTQGVNNCLTVQILQQTVNVGGGGISSCVVEQYQAGGIFNAPPALVNGVVPPIFVNKNGVVSQP